MDTMTTVRAILTDPERAANFPRLARHAWLAACSHRGVRVVQHRLPPVAGFDPLPDPSARELVMRLVSHTLARAAARAALEQAMRGPDGGDAA
jgi:hypothetical protein